MTANPANRLRQGYGGPPIRLRQGFVEPAEASAEAGAFAKAEAGSHVLPEFRILSRRIRVILAALAAIVAGLAWILLGPLPPGLLDLSRIESTIVVDRAGEVLYEARGSDGGRAMRLFADELPKALVDATLAAEDRRFWNHPGIDPIAVARAAIHDIRRRRLAEGGSTISQQVAKLLLARQVDERASGRTEPMRRGFSAKLREAVIAVRLEHRLSKREILALYLNLASYGNQLVGAERACREYFGIGAASATPAQAAFLAALPQRPSTFNPYRSMARATARQQYIIRSMVIDGWLSVDGGTEALHERLDLKREPSAFAAPHFVQRVLGDAETSGRIVTTLDAALQRDVEGSSAVSGSSSSGTARTTSPWWCSTTRAASGWRGKDPGPIRQPVTAAPSTAPSRRGNRAPRSSR